MFSENEFKPIPNPYIVGNPIKTAEMFYGRQDEFEFTKRKIQAGDKSYVIVLCGERRSGKTSILFQILSGKLGDIFLPVLIDMQTMAGLDNDRNFFEEIAQEICRTLKDNRIDFNDYTFHALTESPYKSFKVLLDKVFALYPHKHLILMIDEYEMLEQKFDGGSLNPDIITFFAGLLESARRLSFIFTGSRHLEQRQKIEYWRVLFGKSLYRHISFLSHDDAIRLITEPLRNFVTFAANTIEAIYRLTAGQPFYTQVVCQSLIDHLNERRKNRVEPADIEAVTEDILRNPLPQMIYIWNSLDDMEKLAMSVLAELQHGSEAFIPVMKFLRFLKHKNGGFAASRKELITALENLYDRELVSKKENHYRIAIALLARWIRQEHSFWKIIQEIKPTILAPRAGALPRRHFAKPAYLLAVFAVLALGIVLATNWPFQSQIEKPRVAEPFRKKEITEPTPRDGEKVRAETAQEKMRLLKKEAEEMNAPPVAEKTYHSAVNKQKEAENAFAEGNYMKAVSLFDAAAEFYGLATKKAERAEETRKKLQPATEPISAEEERLANEARDSVIEKRGAAKSAEAEKYAKENFQKGTELEEKGNQARERESYTQARAYYQEAVSYFEKAKESSAAIAEAVNEIKNKIAPIKKEINVTEAVELERRGEEEARTGNFTSALEYYNAAYTLYANRADLINAMGFVLIIGGTFIMGYEVGRSDEQPPHEVSVNDFQMSKFEVTNAQYAAFLNAAGKQTEVLSTWIDLTTLDCQIEKVDGAPTGLAFRAKPGFENHPVVYVTWDGAKAFCDWLGGRLPTEAEWEYACRAGSRSKYYFGDDANKLKENAWYLEQSGDKAHPIGRRPANDFGLYDILGNVWEWCADWYDPQYYSRSATDNPKGPLQGDQRVLRGGAFNSNIDQCRSSCRSPLSPFASYSFVGFRAVRDVH